MPLQISSLDQFQPRSVDWIWPHLVPIGGLTVFESFPSCFKTSITCDIAARISRGRSMPFSSAPVRGGSVLILNAEDQVASLRTRLSLAGADMTRVLTLEDGHRLTLPHQLPELSRWAVGKELRLIILDPLASFTAAPITADAPSRKLVDLLNLFAQRAQLAIIAIRHWTKATGGDSMYRAAGSHSITAAARSELIVGKSTSGTNRLVLAQLKNNLAPLATSIEFEPISHADGVTIKWIGESPLTAHDLMNAPSLRERPVIEEAKRFLVGVLGDGAVSAKVVRTKANDAGLSGATLRRAKDELSIASRRRGFGPESVVLWELPQKDHPTVAPYWAGEMDHLLTQLCHGDEGSDLTISNPPTPNPPSKPSKSSDDGDDGAAVT